MEQIALDRYIELGRRHTIVCMLVAAESFKTRDSLSENPNNPILREKADFLIKLSDILLGENTSILDDIRKNSSDYRK